MADLLKPRGGGSRAIGRNDITADIENLRRCTVGETVSIMAQFNLTSHYLSSGERAVSVKAEELKGGSVISHGYITPDAVTGTAQ